MADKSLATFVGGKAFSTTLAGLKRPLRAEFRDAAATDKAGAP